MGLTGPATTVHSPAIMFPIPIEPSMLPVPCFIPSIMDPIPPPLLRQGNSIRRLLGLRLPGLVPALLQACRWPRLTPHRRGRQAHAQKARPVAILRRKLCREPPQNNGRRTDAQSCFDAAGNA